MAEVRASSLERAIVVFDPNREFHDGTIVDGSSNVRRVAGQGVVLLPYDGDRTQEALGGYCRRGWGAGWGFKKNAGERGCPMVIHATEGRPFFYWSAWVVPVGDAPSGTIKLVGDTSRQSSLAAGLMPTTSSPQLRKGDLRKGGWMIGGKATVNLITSGYLGVALHGVAKDVAVMVSAVSQCAQDTEWPLR